MYYTIKHKSLKVFNNNLKELMENYSKYLIAIAALVFVLSLIGILSYLVKRYGGQYISLPKNISQEKRLKIIEVLHVDGQRKFILIERDSVEHLILLSNNGDVVIENIKNQTRYSIDKMQSLASAAPWWPISNRGAGAQLLQISWQRHGKSRYSRPQGQHYKARQQLDRRID